MEAVKKEEPSNAQREQMCMQEIVDVLKKYNCILVTQFQQDSVLGQPVLKYTNQVVAK